MGLNTMKISQKKNCNNCRAVKLTRGDDILCGLGYKLEYTVINVAGFSIPRVSKILEPCPKPKTYSELFYAKDNYKKQ